jgi:hypothetical protein
MLRALLFLGAIGFSAMAFAETTPPAPQAGGKPLAQVKPRVSTGCKLVGTVKGTKLWAGDCTANEPRGDEATAPTPAPPK